MRAAHAPTVIQGVVVSVRPRGDGRFGVLVGPGPHVYWYVSEEPVQIATRVRVSGRVAGSSQVDCGTRGTITMLVDVRVEAIPPPYATRIVEKVWRDRVKAQMRRELYRYQVDGAAWVAERLAMGKGSILADEMGLGKSTQTVAALCATRLFPAIVVCPMSIKINWEREFALAVKPPSVEMVTGSRGPIQGADVTILNPELLLARENQLRILNPRVMVLDEAQAFKEPLARPRHRAAVATRFAELIGRMVLLTGTPIMNRPRDLWRLLHMIDRWEWADFREFEKHYCRAPREPQVREQRNVVTAHGRLEHIDELHARVQPLMLRRLKRQVLSDLPPKSRRTVSVQLDPADMADYRRAEKNIVAWIREQENGDEKARAAARAQAPVKFTMLRRLAAQYKMRRLGPVHDYLTEWFSQDRRAPLVVFAFHHEVIMRLWEECHAILRGRVAIIGSADDAPKRQRAVDAFNAGYADAFIAPIKCGGVGLNLQARAADVLFIERLWEPAAMEQAEDRVHRIGQLMPVTITTIDAAGTIDDYIAKMTSSKQTLIHHALGDERLSGAVRIFDMFVAPQTTAGQEVRSAHV